MSFVLMLICVFIWGAIIHGMAYILGSRWEIARSIKVAMYSSTPLALLGWIPMLGIFDGSGWSSKRGRAPPNIMTCQQEKRLLLLLIPIILLIILSIVILIVTITTIIPMVLEVFQSEK